MAHFAAPGSYCGAKRGDFEFRYFDEFPALKASRRQYATDHRASFDFTKAALALEG
jgi:hypothetical protein